jgi:hypothetical protein
VARCAALTKAGTQCKNNAVPDGDCCWRHFGASEESLPGPNEKAALRTLQALGVTEDRDAARFQMIRSLAAALDATPTRASLWTAYREALADLAKDDGHGDQSLKEAAEALRSAT